MGKCYCDCIQFRNDYQLKTAVCDLYDKKINEIPKNKKDNCTYYKSSKKEEKGVVVK